MEMNLWSFAVATALSAPAAPPAVPAVKGPDFSFANAYGQGMSVGWVYHVQSEAVLSVGDRLAKIEHALGLSRSQLADMVGVSRQALYGWYRGDVAEIKPDNQSRLEELERLAALAQSKAGRPLNRRALEAAMDDGRKAADVLAAGGPKEREAAVRFAADQTLRMEAKRPKTAPSMAQRRRTIADNLRSMGM